MFMRLFLVYLCIFTSQVLATCPYVRTSIVLTDCVFDTSQYISLGANILNSNSIDFIGYYSIDQTNHLNNTLIYNLGNRWMLLVPLLLKCSRQPVNLTLTECQYTMRQNKYSHRLLSTVEYMTTQLTPLHISGLGIRSVLFLQPGEISLRSCKAYDCSRQLVYITASNETFNFKINYEKPINSKCQYDEDCQSSYSIKDLVHCDKLTQTCQCYSENISSISISGNGRFCTDSIDQSNCTKFPRRCLKWCDRSETSNCVCPKLTRKAIKSNGLYDCELEPTGLCRFENDDGRNIGPNIRKCPTGTYCDGHQCRPSPVLRHVQEEPPDESYLPSALSATSTLSSLSSASKYTRFQNDTAAFVHTVIAIAMAIMLFLIVVVLVITVLIRFYRFRVSSTSSEDKVSSSSFAQSTSTATSSDSPTNANYHQQLKQYPAVTITSANYENYLAESTFFHGLVPPTNLSPRFHRQQNTIDERRRVPLHIRSPSLSRINPFVDHASLATKDTLTMKRTYLPKVTRLQNGNIVISA